MVLKILDRCGILNMLPKNGDTVEMILARSIRRSVEIDSIDIEAFNIELNAEKLTWDVQKDTGKQYDFNSRELELLKRCVADMEKEKKVTEENLDVCLIIKEAV